LYNVWLQYGIGHRSATARVSRKVQALKEEVRSTRRRETNAKAMATLAEGAELGSLESGRGRGRCDRDVEREAL